MTLKATSNPPVSYSATSDQASFLTIASVTAVLAALHFADHVVRGANVRQHGLDPTWNHSGWPFQSNVSPFSISLVAVSVILLGGITFTARGKLWAGYWLVAALVLAALVTDVHLVPGAHQESPSIIYHSWLGNSTLGVLAVVNTFAILVMLAVMAANAFRVGRKTRRWW